MTKYVKQTGTHRRCNEYVEAMSISVFYPLCIQYQMENNSWVGKSLHTSVCIIDRTSILISGPAMDYI